MWWKCFKEVPIKEEQESVESFGRIRIKTGDKFNLLTAVEFLGIRSSHTVWRWLCDCGKMKDIRTTAVWRGLTKSCNCLKSIRVKNEYNSGSNPLRLYNNKRSRGKHSLFREFIAKTKHLKKQHNLTEVDFLRLIESPCFYCGLVKDQIYNRRDKEKTFIFYHVGIDRIDSSKDYLLDNCIPCCRTCNTMKMDVPPSEWLSRIKSIYTKLNLEKSIPTIEEIKAIVGKEKDQQSNGP